MKTWQLEKNPADPCAPLQEAAGTEDRWRDYFNINEDIE